eukprot:4994411-Amphidinium_carterae.1
MCIRDRPYPLLDGTVPLKKVYRMPIPESQGSGHVLGGQAQLWTEYIENKARAFGKLHIETFDVFDQSLRV